MKLSTVICPVCKKRRGRGKDHSKCSALLQLQRFAKDAGKTFESTTGTKTVSAEAQRIGRGRQVAKTYKNYNPPE